MNCRKIDDRLDEFMDGLLTGSERDEVERHVENCNCCRTEVEQQRALREATSRLPREIAPPRDLLPGIRKATAPRSAKTAWTSWAGIAASVAVVSFAAIAGLLLMEDGSGPAVALRGIDEPQAHAATAALGAAEEEYVRAAEVLLDSIELRGGQFSPATRAAVQKNLAIVDEAIGEIKTAIESDPEQPGSADELTAMYRKKLEFLWRVSRLSS